MRYYKVAHDFTAVESVELSVHKGEVVCSIENVVQEGWMKVEVTTDALRRGFVPLSYLKEMSAEEVLRQQQAAAPQQQVTSGREGDAMTTAALHTEDDGRSAHSDEAARSGGSAGRRASTGHNTSTPRRQRTETTTATITPGGSAARTPITNAAGPTSLRDTALQYGATIAGHSPRQTPQAHATSSPVNAAAASANATKDSPSRARPPAAAATGAVRQGGQETSAADNASSLPLTPAKTTAGPISRSLLSNPNTVVDAFMKNEIYFKQLMRRRVEAMAKLQTELEEANAEVAACKDKNATLSRKLRELDQVIEKERQRWTERVNEEKTYVLRSLSYTGKSNVAPSASASPAVSPVSARRGKPGAGGEPSSIIY